MTALRRAIDDYLTLRRRLGVTRHEAERVLVAFAAYAERERAEHVTTDLVLRWTMQLAGIAAATVNGRCQIIRRFAQWRQLADPLTEAPPADLVPGRYRRHPPRLYREEDIPRLLEAAHALASPKGLRGRTYATLFGLLAVTGLRSSEVVGLDDGDLDRREATLRIRRTKFGKSRLVPLHASTMDAVTSYQAIRNRMVPHRHPDALLSPSAACGSRRMLPSTRLRASRPRSGCDGRFVVIGWDTALASTTYDIDSRSGRSSRAIGPAAPSTRCCRYSPRISAMCTSTIRTGIWKRWEYVLTA
jgi:integrase